MAAWKNALIGGLLDGFRIEGWMDEIRRDGLADGFRKGRDG